MSGVDPSAEFAPRRRWLPVTPVVELGVLVVAVAIAVGSYFAIATGHDSQKLMTPPLVALLLVINLVPAMGLIMLLGRRVAIRRAAQAPGGSRGRLHVRLVAIFSVLAALPMLAVTIVASLLFQYGVEFWFSDRARSMLDNASQIAQQNYNAELNRVRGEADKMAGDISNYLQQYDLDSLQFQTGLTYQTWRRELNQAVILHQGPDGTLNTIAVALRGDPENKRVAVQITPAMLAQLDQSGKVVAVNSLRGPGALAKLNYGNRNYLFVKRFFDAHSADLIRRGTSISNDYHTMIERSRSLQIKFNAALFIASLLIVGIAVWIALVVADRLVRPIGELVGAAQRIGEGDLAARVTPPSHDDEIGTLALAFNRMTSTLEAQTGALVTANNQLDRRRALIEAVMSGVTAGVISIDADRTIQLVNSSAAALLDAAERDPVGQPLKAVAPELDALLDGGQHEAIVQIAADGEPKTLAVKITGDAAGQVLTFDDITQQLIDQRRAAWSDVARRIAHEIKNPLTPIQLAAERLQRRYGKQFDGQDATFNRLTETIVRQVGDLRRMVDEFSSFARMPKPVFREESLVDIARQALFLHEVAHPNVAFRLDYDEPAPMLVCDRRQIGQALTNIVKNAVEAIEAKDENAKGEIVMTLAAEDGATTITVTDDGVGLPSERSRLVEPYMTTRARGTGLGLAIVKKIAEEHFGEITFADRPGGGTIVTMRFDTRMLAAIDSSGATPDASGDDAPLPALTRNRNS
jgi:two-component system nitrogen regulation sensor histidine kinase NtrY